MKMPLRERICKNPACKIPFTPERENEKYHNHKCKVDANNAIAREIRIITKTVDATLKRNWKILNFLFDEGVTEITFENLLSHGFDYSKHTGRSKDTNGNLTVPEFYNYKLEKINNNTFKIILI